jgi:hypothetical protein
MHLLKVLNTVAGNHGDNIYIFTDTKFSIGDTIK